MVRCKNCNKNYSKKTKECPFCGYKPDTDIIEDINKDGRTGKRKLIVPIVIAIAIFCMVLAACLFFMGNKMRKYNNYIEKEDYASAQQYLETELINDEKAKTAIINEMTEKIKECEEKYQTEEVGLEETVEKLDEYSLIQLTSEQAKEAKDRVVRLGESRTHYANALKLEQGFDYVGAMEQYKLVIEQDSNYQTAKEKYEECFGVLKKNALQKAEEFKASQSYAEAIAELETCLSLKEDEELSQAIANMRKEKEDYDNAMAEQARIEQDKINAEREARANKLRGLIKVSRVSCDEPNSEGGVNVYVNFKNVSDRKIQSILFRLVPLDGSGNILICKKNNASIYPAKLTGPFKKGEGLLDQNRYWPNAWYNKEITDVKLVGVEITYNKGKTETITEEEIQYIYKER